MAFTQSQKKKCFDWLIRELDPNDILDNIFAYHHIFDFETDLYPINQISD